MPRSPMAPKKTESRQPGSPLPSEEPGIHASASASGMQRPAPRGAGPQRSAMTSLVGMQLHDPPDEQLDSPSFLSSVGTALPFVLFAPLYVGLLGEPQARPHGTPMSGMFATIVEAVDSVARSRHGRRRSPAAAAPSRRTEPILIDIAPRLDPAFLDDPLADARHVPRKRGRDSKKPKRTKAGNDRERTKSRALADRVSDVLGKAKPALVGFACGRSLGDRLRNVLQGRAVPPQLRFGRPGRPESGLPSMTTSVEVETGCRALHREPRLERWCDLMARCNDVLKGQRSSILERKCARAASGGAPPVASRTSGRRLVIGTRRP